MKQVMYVCNKKKSCNTSVSCGECMHTLNKEYAKYNDHDWKDFDEIMPGVYVERVRDEQR